MFLYPIPIPVIMKENLDVGNFSWDMEWKGYETKVWRELKEVDIQIYTLHKLGET